MTQFDEIDLSAVGTSVQLVGGVWAGDGHAYIFYFPEYGQEFEATPVAMTQADWARLLRQSDLVETEVLSKLPDGTLYKAVVRKCTRNIDQQVTWNVFRRDSFACVYCGREDAPLTVDHLILWEDGGPTTEANLVSACRKCNKTRGRTKYVAWLQHPYYKTVSKKLTPAQRGANEALAAMLDQIPLVVNVRSR